MGFIDNAVGKVKELQSEAAANSRIRKLKHARRMGINVSDSASEYELEKAVIKADDRKAELKAMREKTKAKYAKKKPASKGFGGGGFGSVGSAPSFGGGGTGFKMPNFNEPKKKGMKLNKKLYENYDW